MPFWKSTTETIEVYVRAEGQSRYQSWPFDDATMILRIDTNYVPREHESIQLKQPVNGRTNFQVITVGYRLSGSTVVPCILVDA